MERAFVMYVKTHLVITTRTETITLASQHYIETADQKKQKAP